MDTTQWGRKGFDYEKGNKVSKPWLDEWPRKKSPIYSTANNSEYSPVAVAA